MHVIQSVRGGEDNDKRPPRRDLFAPPQGPQLRLF
jgi:hypothetical protein